MSLSSEAYLELLDILDKKEDLIRKQDFIIRRLLDDNLEKENAIEYLGSL